MYSLCSKNRDWQVLITSPSLHDDRCSRWNQIDREIELPAYQVKRMSELSEQQGIRASR